MNIYLDSNATTIVDEEVLSAMEPYWRQCFANASSDHQDGRRARQAVEKAREQIADAIEAHPSEVVFTSSGTESNNAIIKGVAKMSIKNSMAVSAIEHPCVLCAVRSLQDAFRVNFIAVDKDGIIDTDDLQDILKQDCALVSIMLANNETGVIQDIASLAKHIKASGAFMHTDAAQALGKIPISFRDLGVDAMTITAHKCYGPKGIAALIVNREVPWAPLLEGGGQEQERRSGTENVSGIVGFGQACQLAATRVYQQEKVYLRQREFLEKELVAAGAVIFGANVKRLPNTCYFGFPRIDGGAMVTMLDQSGFAVASGAACSSMKGDPSHVLLAMDYSPEIATTAVRVSLGMETSDEDVARFVGATVEIVRRLEQMSSVVAY